MARVLVLGGGVAGLTVAHELATRGFDVTICDRRTDGLWGGKARSFGNPGTAVGRRRDLPGEHGFRFFPGFYKHVTDTMQRIPTDDGRTAFDSLVPTTEVLIAQQSGPMVRVPARFPQSFREFRAALADWRHRGDLGVPPDETMYFAGRLLDIFTACAARRFETYEYYSWWTYIGAATRSAQYQRMLGVGLTRSLVAMKAELSNARIIGTMLEQILKYVLEPGRATDRVLNGPTSEVWLDPWVKFLEARGVTLVGGAEVTAIGFDGTQVTGVTIAHQGGTTEEWHGDFYVAALPVEVIRPLMTPALREVAPQLDGLDQLQVEWMNGIVFYLNRDVRIGHGHVILIDSPWAVTCVSQPQFWPDQALARYGDGTVKGILSVDISNWTTPGEFTTSKRAEDCTGGEIAAECWAQIKAHLPEITDRDLVAPIDAPGGHSWFLDPDIDTRAAEAKVRARRAMVREAAAAVSPSGHVQIPPSPDPPPLDVNFEPLMINTRGSYRYRPQADVGLPNFFLAGDYVRTHTDLACMEGANESGRRAANAVLAAAGRRERCRVWPLQGLVPFAPFRALDWCLFVVGLPQIPFKRLPRMTRAMLLAAGLVLQARILLRALGAAVRLRRTGS